MKRILLIFYLMKTSQSQRSGTGFILIHGHTKEETPITWDWLTQRGVKPPTNQAQVEHYATEKYTYSQKKAMLTELQPRQRVQSSFKIKTGFSEKVRPRTISTAPSIGRSQRPLKSYAYLNSKAHQRSVPDQYGLDVDNLARKVIAARENGTKVLGVIVARRMGLRFKFQQAFISFCACKKTVHSHDLDQLSQKLAQQMRWGRHGDQKTYFFQLSGQPLHSYKQLLQDKPRVVLAETCAKLQLPHSVHVKVLELGRRLEEQINILTVQISKTHQKDNQRLLKDDGQKIYDWQRIKSVREYVNQLANDPIQNRLRSVAQPQNKLINWYKQKYTDSREVKSDDKNLLFESKSRFPNQAANVDLLHLANQQVEALPTTNNRHKFVPRPLDMMVENVRRQMGQGQERESPTKEINARGQKPQLSTSPIKKDRLLALQLKNSLLSTQNIPYLIEKYGLNRFQLYNLYNLYKSFQKVALMKHPQLSDRVFEKGIDRDTFEVGLKNLDMNPGDELIKNICIFGDFISWEQFIKIISISLRKTPEEKLSAILRSISASDHGYLTKYQISIMIGSSLVKLFDHEQSQLRDYFTDIAMKQLDPQGQDRVAIDLLKQKILHKDTDNLNMVAFLILNT